SFDHSLIEIAANRTDVTFSEESDIPIEGVFGGAFPVSRRFEMFDVNHEVVRGGIDAEVPADDITAINRAFSGNPCVAQVRRVTIERAGGRPQGRNTLLRVEPRGG